MMLRIGSKAPNFRADSTEGHIHFHEWMGDAWCIFFSHPKDFTPVCATELGSVAGMKPAFDVRNCKLLALSVDSVADHKRWMDDVEIITGHRPNFPIIGDPFLKVAKHYGMLPDDAGEDAKARSALDNHTVRTTFVIAPDKTIKAMVSYPMTTGRNFHEILRLLESVQLTAKHKLATPANWQHGDDVIIVPSISDEEARKYYPRGWRAPKPYVRFVRQPVA
jgi:alkyl hydroperoxide reductase subunit AhpC